MTDVHALAYASSLDVDDLTHWQELVASGFGYSRMAIPQRRRRPREVYRPSVELDRLLKQLRAGLTSLSGYAPDPAVHGFVRGRDIVTNATSHLDQDVVLRVDLADYFGTIDDSKLIRALTNFGFKRDAADAVAGLTLVEGALAQGFSTSPFLSNLAFAETDVALVALASREGVSYTRYVDDLTVSGPFASIHDGLLAAISAILDGQGWSINPRKTRFMRRGRPQYVTGLYVGDGDRPHIPRSMKRLLRREVYYAGKFGLEDAHLKSPTPMPHDRLNGWVNYAAHADPVFGAKLKAIWNEVPDRRYTNRPVRDWDLILEAIGFPEDW